MHVDAFTMRTECYYKCITAIISGTREHGNFSQFGPALGRCPPDPLAGTLHQFYLGKAVLFDGSLIELVHLFRGIK